MKEKALELLMTYGWIILAIAVIIMAIKSHQQRMQCIQQLQNKETLDTICYLVMDNPTTVAVLN